jgi:putative membrane protein
MLECAITMDVFLNYLYHFGLAVLFLIIFSAIYLVWTPYREVALIKEGNLAAAISFLGALLGFGLPVASVISNSVNLLDMAVWSVVALIVQILAFTIIRLAFPFVAKDIINGKVPSSVFLASFSVVVGLLNAACMTY